MEELLQLIAKTYGLVGLLIVAPFVATVYLWKQNAKLHAEVVFATQAATKATEQRVTDAQQITTKIIALVEEQAGLNKETNIALDQVRELLMTISTRKSS